MNLYINRGLAKRSSPVHCDEKSPQLSLKAFAVWTGLEPATPCVTGRYSNQLNYQTVLLVKRCKCTIILQFSKHGIQKILSLVRLYF